MFLLAWSLILVACFLAAGIFKYNIAHYEPATPRESMAIMAPKRPPVEFEACQPPVMEDDLLQLDYEPAANDYMPEP